MIIINLPVELNNFIYWTNIVVVVESIGVLRYIFTWQTGVDGKDSACAPWW